MSDLFTERKSGLLIPRGTDVKKANEEVAEEYRQDAITQAVDLMKIMHPADIASFLWTKNSACDVIANG